MNIYIYGNKTFKKDISKILKKQSIVNRLDEIAQLDEFMGQVIEIRTSKELKNKIELEPDSIFLIDDKKIIYDDNFSKIINFLGPKDGIKEKILKKHKMTITIELNDVNSITQYILDKFDTYKLDKVTQLDEIRENNTATAISEI
jgi:hypothetical protein